MSYYEMCCQHRGKVVSIYEKSGKMHYGRIVEVDREYVWIEPTGARPRGFGYGYYGYGGYPGYGYHGHGFHRPFWVPVALAAIGGFALGAAFFWI